MSEGYSLKYIKSKTAEELAAEMTRISNARIAVVNELAVANGVLTAVVQTAGGTVEGHPTSSQTETLAGACSSSN